MKPLKGKEVGSRGGNYVERCRRPLAESWAAQVQGKMRGPADTGSTQWRAYGKGHTALVVIAVMA